MIRRIFAAIGMLGLLLASPTLTAHAQDILGLSLRPTDAMTGAPGRGTVDITRSNGEGKYVIKVDMSGAAEGMDLAAFEGATDWVVWAVDMDGLRHNIGSLDGELMLESAAVDYMVARVYVTAEESADVDQPSDPLFSITLRQVAEVDTAPADEDTSEASDEAATEDEAADETEEDAAEETPAELPTTGGPVTDMALLLAVAALLLAGGMRLRTVALR